jgi:microcystin-dependent protein
MIAFAGNKVPNGCLLCDGGAVGKRSYPDLFGVIDTAYGGSVSNFKFPDFRGMFFERCWFINY